MFLTTLHPTPPHSHQIHLPPALLSHAALKLPASPDADLIGHFHCQILLEHNGVVEENLISLVPAALKVMLWTL